MNASNSIQYSDNTVIGMKQEMRLRSRTKKWQMFANIQSFGSSDLEKILFCSAAHFFYMTLKY